MTFEELCKEIFSNPNPENQAVAKHMQSFAYQLGLEILGLRVKNHLTTKQAAKIVGLPYNQYLRFENGLANNKNSKLQYQKIINKLTELTNSK